MYQTKISGLDYLQKVGKNYQGDLTVHFLQIEQDPNDATKKLTKELFSLVVPVSDLDTLDATIKSAHKKTTEFLQTLANGVIYPP